MIVYDRKEFDKLKADGIFDGIHQFHVIDEGNGSVMRFDNNITIPLSSYSASEIITLRKCNRDGQAAMVEFDLSRREKSVIDD